MKGKPVTLWCVPCGTGYASAGEVPTLCPECGQVPHWTTTPPFKPTHNDKRFLRSLRIDPEEP